MISVIIPVYNVNHYLDECVQSVVAQICQNWECILVDDGSTDGSGRICDEWGEKDGRIRVFHQENGGVSRARNKGMEEAKGDYVVFVDSDDWLGQEHLEKLLDAPQADLVVSGVTQLGTNGTNLAYRPSCNKTFTLNEESLEDFVALNRKFLLYAPYVKLYKTSILRSNHICFPVDCNYGEDLQFNLKYLQYVKTITLVEDASYYYRRGSETLSTKKRSNQFYQDYDQWKMLQRFYKERSLWLKPSKELLYERLWGIIYDGIFSTSTNNKEILAIPEIKDLRKYQHVFHCSWWIKWCILHRIAFVFK
jgi:glycosyltransferase involved in cell wall biosynthesis